MIQGRAGVPASILPLEGSMNCQEGGVKKKYESSIDKSGADFDGQWPQSSGLWLASCPTVSSRLCSLAQEGRRYKRKIPQYLR